MQRPRRAGRTDGVKLRSTACCVIEPQKRSPFASHGQCRGASKEEMEQLYYLFFTTMQNGAGPLLRVGRRGIAHPGEVLPALNNSDSGMAFTAEVPLCCRADA